MIKKMYVLLTVIIIVFTLSACRDSGPTLNDDGSVTEEFSYFMTASEDVQYYEDYSKNPYVEYIESKVWNTDDEGRDLYLDFQFQAPLLGKELEQVVTMFATGEYLDIMSTDHYKRAGSIKDLYNQGVILDLTHYVENYMPNYLAFLDAHPEYKKFVTADVDGEQKYLELYNYNDLAESFWGLQYRRDWIVEYADEVYPGTQFSRWEDEDGNYQDDVIFPNGTTDPIYISDWEWMFEIFEYALKDLSITDGYVTTVPYSGYAGTGELISGAGGQFYLDGDTIEFGPVTDSFRSYLKMVHTWYETGWLDTRFAERTNDMFYQINVTGIMSGKVGLWYSNINTLDENIVSGLPNSPENGYTEGAYVFGARQPINDVYGDEREPFVFYQPSLEFSSIVITEKAKDKDLEALFTALDYGFSEEGALIKTYGLNAEQYELTQNELMTRENLQDGAYTTVTIDGVEKIRYVDKVNEDQKLRQALVGTRFFGLAVNTLRDLSYSNTKAHSMEQIDYYRSTGYLRDSFVGQLNVDQLENYAKTQSNVQSFLARNLPAFINGEKDPFDDSQWNALVSAINKYGIDAAISDLQELYDKFND
ncbi:MAG: hypothetical protein ACVCEJ_04155 [Candidatus Izemoplasmataceae bacterium]